MEMLTGNGQPPKHLKGQLGQHYKDLKTGDMYELVSANEFSTIHHAPVRGYIWKRVARGEHMEVCAGGAGGSGGAFVVNVTAHYDDETGEAYTSDMTVEEIMSAYESGMSLTCVIHEEYDGETYAINVLRDVSFSSNRDIVFHGLNSIGGLDCFRWGLRFTENGIKEINDIGFITGRPYFLYNFFMVSTDRTLWRVSIGNDGTLTTENCGRFVTSIEKDESNESDDPVEPK